MGEFFARLYEWWGLVSFYSKDFGEYLRGWDFACVGYFAIRWYLLIGWLMIFSTVVIYGLQYDVISTTRFSQLGHWWLVAFTIAVVNFFLACILPAAQIFSGSYCLRLKLSLLDCLGFGISNAIWSFLLFALLSAITPLRSFIIGWRNPSFKEK